MKKNYSGYFLIFIYSIIISLFYTSSKSQPTYRIYQEDGKFGFKNDKQKVTIPPQFEKLGWSKGLDIPVDDVLGYYDGAWGMITTSNKKITRARYYSLEAVHKDLIIASTKEKFSNALLYGVLNSRGNVIIDFKYHYLSPFKNIFIVAERRNGKIRYGLLSQQNKIYLPLSYNKISHYHDDLFVFENTSKKKGIMHENGTILIKATLDSIAPRSHNFSLVYQSGKVGAIDSLGIYIHEPIYKSISQNLKTKPFKKYQFRISSDSLVKVISCDSLFEMSSELFAIVRNKSVEILDKDYNPIFETKNLIGLSVFKQNIIFKKEGKYHLIKGNGKVIEKESIDNLLFDKHHIYGRIGDYWRIYDDHGSNISKWKFDSVLTGSNRLIPVKKNGYWGYIDYAGKIAIPMKYDKVGKFVDNIAAVDYLGSKYVINQFGEILKGHSFDFIKIGQYNIALVTRNSRTDMIDNKGKILFQTFNSLISHPFGYLEKKENGDLGLISHSGEVILKPDFDAISSPISGKYLEIRKGGKVGLIDSKGRQLVQLTKKYQGFSHISENLIGVKKNNQFGFIDYDGKLLIANRYEGIQAFSDKLAAVKINGKWGCINEKEKLVVQPRFQKMNPYKNGISLVERKGEHGAINQEGKEIIKIEYDQILHTKNDFLLTKKNEKSGLYNQSGLPLLRDAYTKISPTKDGNFIIQRRGLTGVVNSSAHYVITLKYQTIQEMTNNTYLCTLPEKEAE